MVNCSPSGAYSYLESAWERHSFLDEPQEYTWEIDKKGGVTLVIDAWKREIQESLEKED